MTSRDPFNNEFGNSLRDSLLEKQVKDLRKRVEQLEFDAESVEQLQEEISKLKRDKQDKILFVEIFSEEGILDEESLNVLRDNLCNRIVYQNTVYYLSITDRPLRKYFSKLQLENNEIDVNLTTGEFWLHSSSDALKIDEHIKDKIIHISQSDRNRWNNKVTAYAEPIVETLDDNTLVLTKDDIENIEG